MSVQTLKSSNSKYRKFTLNYGNTIKLYYPSTWQLWNNKTNVFSFFFLIYRMSIIKCVSVRKRDNYPSLNLMARKLPIRLSSLRNWQINLKRIWMQASHKNSVILLTQRFPWLRIIWCGLYSGGAQNIQIWCWKDTKWICSMRLVYDYQMAFWTSSLELHLDERFVSEKWYLRVFMFSFRLFLLLFYFHWRFCFCIFIIFCWFCLHFCYFGFLFKRSWTSLVTHEMSGYIFSKVATSAFCYEIYWGKIISEVA